MNARRQEQGQRKTRIDLKWGMFSQIQSGSHSKPCGEQGSDDPPQTKLILRSGKNH